MKKTGHIEPELKLDVFDVDIGKILEYCRTSKWRAGPGRQKDSVRAYYDTPDFDLDRRGVALRMQMRGGKNGKFGGWEQTVKVDCNDLASGYAKDTLLRNECKDKMPNCVPSLGSVTDREGHMAVEGLSSKPLRLIFNVVTERHILNLKVKEGGIEGKVELAFDKGTMLVDNNTVHEDFSQIEIELKGGDRRAIGVVEAMIRKKFGHAVRHQTLSKAQQGIILYCRHHNLPYRPTAAVV